MKMRTRTLRAGALKLLDSMAAAHDHPAVLCSFGKDSMVMLHLVREAGYDWPVVCFQEEWLPRKWEFAHRVAREWELTMHVWPPAAAWVYEYEGTMVLGSTWIVAGMPIAVPKDVEEDTEPGARCGCDFLSRTRGSAELQADLLLIGHKDSDRDSVCGAVPLNQTYIEARDGMPAVVFPMRAWTDADVYDYTMAHDIPVDWRRYEAPFPGTGHDAFIRKTDTTLNTDVLHCCCNCLKIGHAGKDVVCPLSTKPIRSIADEVLRMPTLQRPHFTAENALS